MERNEENFNRNFNEGNFIRDINKIREPQIFNVSDLELSRSKCWPDCEPCSPTNECSPDVICIPDVRGKCWPDCSPCNPNDFCSPDLDTINDERCWPDCSPCNPEDYCRPDFDEGGK